MSDKRIPVILDVDTGVDDTFALIYALASDKLEVKAVTTCHGNCDLEKTTDNTLRVLEFLGYTDIPVGIGSAHPLMSFYEDVPFKMHGNNGLGDVELPEAKVLKPCSLNAVDLMAKVVNESEEPVWIVGVAPLTNVALFLHCHAELRSKIAGVAIMGGGSYMGNASISAEANIFHDTHAAAMVFKAGVKLVMCGLECTMGAYISPEERKSLLELPGDIAKFCYECLGTYEGIYTGLGGYPGAALHDGVPLAWLTDPDKVATTPAFGEIDVWGNSTFGNTNIDYEGRVSGRDCNMLVADSIDREWYIGEIKKAIVKLTK